MFYKEKLKILLIILYFFKQIVYYIYCGFIPVNLNAKEGGPWIIFIPTNTILIITQKIIPWRDNPTHPTGRRALRERTDLTKKRALKELPALRNSRQLRKLRAFGLQRLPKEPPSHESSQFKSPRASRSPRKRIFIGLRAKRKQKLKRYLPRL